MKYITSIFITFLFLTHTVTAAPWPHVRVPKITGTIVAFTWIGGFSYQQEEVWRSVNFPGLHEMGPVYVLLLGKTNIDKERRDKLTDYSANMNFKPRIFDRPREDDEVLILIESPRRKDLKIGTEVEISDYEVAADEFRTWETHKEFKVFSAPSPQKQKAPGTGGQPTKGNKSQTESGPRE